MRHALLAGPTPCCLPARGMISQPSCSMAVFQTAVSAQQCPENGLCGFAPAAQRRISKLMILNAARCAGTQIH